MVEPPVLARIGDERIISRRHAGRIHLVILRRSDFPRHIVEKLAIILYLLWNPRLFHHGLTYGLRVCPAEVFLAITGEDRVKFPAMCVAVIAGADVGNRCRRKAAVGPIPTRTAIHATVTGISLGDFP